MAEPEWIEDLEEAGEILDDLYVLLRLLAEVDPEHAERVAEMLRTHLEGKFRELTGHDWPWESDRATKET